jgi:hypothetical protein
MPALQPPGHQPQARKFSNFGRQLRRAVAYGAQRAQAAQARGAPGAVLGAQRGVSAPCILLQTRGKCSNGSQAPVNVVNTALGRVATGHLKTGPRSDHTQERWRDCSAPRRDSESGSAWFAALVWGRGGAGRPSAFPGLAKTRAAVETITHRCGAGHTQSVCAWQRPDPDSGQASTPGPPTKQPAHHARVVGGVQVREAQRKVVRQGREAVGAHIQVAKVAQAGDLGCGAGFGGVGVQRPGDLAQPAGILAKVAYSESARTSDGICHIMFLQTSSTSSAVRWLSSGGSLGGGGAVWVPWIGAAFTLPLTRHSRAALQTSSFCAAAKAGKMRLPFPAQVCQPLHHPPHYLGAAAHTC